MIQTRYKFSVQGVAGAGGRTVDKEGNETLEIFNINQGLRKIGRKNYSLLMYLRNKNILQSVRF